MKALEVINATLAYHVSYRIAGVETPQGSSEERYADLIGQLEKLKPVIRRGHFADEAHTATSSWIVRSADKAPALVASLGKKLTPGVDLLEVVEIIPGNRAELTKKASKPKKR
jgi:hypothetical protein